MCSPMAIGIGLMAGGSLFSAYGQYQTGKYLERQGKINQQISNDLADNAIERGKIAEHNQRVRTAQFKGEQRASYGASGVDVNSGSPLNVVTDTAELGELDALTIRHNAELESYRYRAQGQQERERGRIGRYQSNINATSTLLTGGSKAFNAYSNIR